MANKMPSLTGTYPYVVLVGDELVAVPCLTIDQAAEVEIRSGGVIFVPMDIANQLKRPQTENPWLSGLKMQAREASELALEAGWYQHVVSPEWVQKAATLLARLSLGVLQLLETIERTNSRHAGSDEVHLARLQNLRQSYASAQQLVETLQAKIDELAALVPEGAP